MRRSPETALKPAGWHYGRRVYWVESLPLVGHIAFGVIDRGTNVLQVRPSTLCFHDCIFCSVDAGASSRWRRSEYMVNWELLVEWVEHVSRVKGGGVEALIDGVGEPLTHPQITRIISALKDMNRIERVALETHGGSLSRSLARTLEKAGLDRINLSVDAANPSLARLLVGVEWYDVNRVLRTAEWIIANTSIDVVLTPVVLPGVNEEEMLALIRWAKRVGAGRKSGWPTGILIQKFEAHKYGRRPAGLKRLWGWRRFYSWLAKLERETGYKLLVDPREIGFEQRPKIEKPFDRGDRVTLSIIGPGWHRGEVLTVDRGWRRVVALYGLSNATDLNPGVEVKARIVRDKDNIFIAVPD
ncbi:radical SAM protein [Aeropyrum camini]|uniref:Predicted Fe-S oxidoreductase n=1 Tax=Aeropyrum camini SY1 = JCM 12091 TaxID=1198449 RepID=U3TAW2_9CREN|nr:radical SAM protein [Aeropyrum camini]BAN90647.1 predicted Fe-S oxidoreductase [Aeropyrum camini SY1 = JCM 12091]